MNGGIKMENRIDVLRKFIESIMFNAAGDKEYRHNYMSHMNSVSQFCALIAHKRGENAELATMAGLLHDFHSYKNLNSDDHAKKGAVLAREVLGELKLTSSEETDLICSAIYNHTSKGGTFSAFDEVLIDADVLQHYLFNITLPVAEWEKARLGNLFEEFSLNSAV